MAPSWDDGYFPSQSTPIRDDHLQSPSPNKGFGSGGSVSSSMLGSPKRYNDDYQSGQEDGNGPEDEGVVDSPAVQQLKRATGFASVRVGLGSPQLALNRDWGSMKRRESVPPEYEDATTPRAVESGKIYAITAFPTPPGTESDIAQPPPFVSRSSSSSYKVRLLVRV